MVCVANIAAHRQPQQFAHKVIFQAGANDLPFIAQVFRPDKTDHTVYQEWIESTGDTVGACFQSQLINPMVSFSGKRTALTCLEVHDVCPRPVHVPSAMMLQYLLTALP